MSKHEALTFNEEYAIKSSWHEILPNTALNPSDEIFDFPMRLNAMETINQFIARHTYTDFMNILGAEAQYQQQILDQGYGYYRLIREFRKLLKDLQIVEEIALRELKEIHLNVLWTKQADGLVDALAEISPLKEMMGKQDLASTIQKQLESFL